MKKELGISTSELEHILDGYVLNQGGRLDVERLRNGLELLVRKNNEALLADIKAELKKDEQ